MYSIQKGTVLTNFYKAWSLFNRIDSSFWPGVACVGEIISVKSEVKKSARSETHVSTNPTPQTRKNMSKFFKGFLLARISTKIYLFAGIQI